MDRRLLLSLLAVSVCAEDRWVWSEARSTQANDVLTPRIPGRVEPHPRQLQPRFSTPAPDITTFRPSLPVSFGHSISSRSQAGSSFPPFLPFMPPFTGIMGLHGLQDTSPHLQQQQQQQQQKIQQQHQNLLQSPQSALLSRPPSHGLPLPGDGTTKSRVPDDTAFDSMAVLGDEDKYTTLDKHQSEYKQTQPLPRPSEEHLGGLDPNEVFYADKDLLIIKGGGFNNDKFEEPNQSLDDSHHDDLEFGQGSDVSPLVVPNPDLEYNGNVPVIVPPPARSPEPTGHTSEQSHFAVFVESPSRTSAMILQVPFIYPYKPSFAISSSFSSGLTEAEHSHNSLDVKRSAEERPLLPSPSEVKGLVEEFPKLHSLAGDTAVNYREPRPAINPDAEFVVQDQPNIVLLNEATSVHRPSQLVYQKAPLVYFHTTVYPYQHLYHQPNRYQHVYHQPNRVEVYKRPLSINTRPRPKL